MINNSRVIKILSVKPTTDTNSSYVYKLLEPYEKDFYLIKTAVFSFSLTGEQFEAVTWLRYRSFYAGL
jgi:hypothetical protein